MLYKVTGACHSVCVCGGWVWWCMVVWGSEGGGQGREGVQLPDSLVDESCPSVCWSWPGDSAVSSLMVADWRSYVSGGWDHLQCRGLCGWDGCCRCPGGRGERHQRSSQLLSLSVEGTCGRTRCRRHTHSDAASQNALDGASVEGAHAAILPIVKSCSVKTPVADLSCNVTQQRLNATPDSRAVWKQWWSDDFENHAVWTRH